MTVPTNEEIRALWRGQGGQFHGPHVEHAVIKEVAFYEFCRELVRKFSPPPNAAPQTGGTQVAIPGSLDAPGIR